MSLISYNGICELIEQGVIKNAKMENVNGTSLDLVLGDEFMFEDERGGFVNMDDKHKSPMLRFRNPDGYHLAAGEFILAHTVEEFALPLDVSAEYMLKSTQARNGLEHLGAGWADAGWSGVLTLEFKNMLRHHEIYMRPGMKCGQMKFYRHDAVPEERSYKVRGQYNGDKSVSAGKGMR